MGVTRPWKNNGRTPGGHYSSSLGWDKIVDDRLHPGPEAERFLIVSFHSLDKLSGEKFNARGGDGRVWRCIAFAVHLSFSAGYGEKVTVKRENFKFIFP